MIKDVCDSICHNKNILMFFTVLIYILALFGVLSNHLIFVTAFLFSLFLAGVIKNLFSPKIIFVWTLVFLVGVFNTFIRLKQTDELLNIAPVNSTITGKIISIPKGNEKVKFFFKVNQIEYDGLIKKFNDEKVLVSLDTNEKLNIYDSYKIRGRLSVPFKAGNPSQFDYGNYLRNFNTYAVFYGHNPYNMRDLDVPCYDKIESDKNFLEKSLQKINNYRENILSVHAKYLLSPYLEILGGIVFGDDAVAPPENIRQSFINSGLLHILAASGMNVAFIYAFFFFILRILKVNFKLNIIICMLAVLTYVMMTGLGASVLRAAFMLLFVLVGKIIDRDANNISLLSFVAFLMLLYNPMYINDVGFQLSFIVTFGLLVMTPYLIKSKYGIVNWLASTIFIPVFAQLWVIPIQIFYFNNISIYSIFANIMSVPILSVISFGGFISSLLSLINPIADFVCKIFDFILSPLLKILVQISNYWGSLPHASLQTTHPSVIQILLYYAILLNLIWLWDKEIRDKWKNTLIKTLPVLFMILFISMINLPNKNLEITAFDVGNADSFLLKTPDNKYIMIDTGKSGYNGGKSQAEIIMLKYFKDTGIKNLDKIIVTHFDNDHSGGAVDLMNGLNVKDLYVNSLNHPSAKLIYKTAKTRGVNIIEAENGQSVLDENGVKIVNFINKGIKGIGDNESSIVTLLTYKDFSMLFTGDAGIETFNNLKTHLPQNITVLKVGHHGAPGVVDKQMADYLNPKYSIVSTGENKFGHPSVYTLSMLRNSKILRTDINNSVKIIVNNDTQVYCYDSKKRQYSK